MPEILSLGTVPAAKLLALRAVTGMVILADPLKDVAVPVAAPDNPMVLAVVNVAAEPVVF
jgi:hypothetical protein